MLINTNNMNTYLFIKLAWVVTGQLGRPQSFQPSLARGVITICPAPPWRCWAGAAGRSPGPPPPPPACRWRGAGVRRAGTWGRGPARGPRTPATQPSPPPVKNYYNNTVQNDSNNKHDGCLTSLESERLTAGPGSSSSSPLPSSPLSEPKVEWLPGPHSKLSSWSPSSPARLSPKSRSPTSPTNTRSVWTGK